MEKLQPVPLREKRQKDTRLFTNLNNSARLCTRSVGVAKESRPEGFGICINFSTALGITHRVRRPHRQSSGKFLRSSASQCLTIWRHDRKGLGVISVSDAGGIGRPPTENGENVQNAHLIMTADCEIQLGVQAKASPLMWRSNRCKRVVNSTFAGEMISMSSALADAEWAHVMLNDVRDQAVTTRDSTKATLPFQVALRSDCTLSKRVPHDHSIEAKSVFDASIKECAGSRQDRRTAVDLAIVRETLKAQGSRTRWIPHRLSGQVCRE